MLLLPLLYLPPLSYMALLSAVDTVYIEAQENYIKSTYRNRCEIIGSNGSIDLSIPLKGGRDHHQLYRESAISYANDWQHRHYMSILSCYGSAPFFEHYMPYLKPFYDKPYANLFEYNKELLALVIRLMKLNTRIGFTTVFEKEPIDKADLRKAFKPSHPLESISIGDSNWQITEVPYMRVFDLPFSSNLSCLDLLFNEGPNARAVLQQMIIRE